MTNLYSLIARSFILLCLSWAVAAAGVFDRPARPSPETAAKLKAVRAENLQAGVRGPVKSYHLRYRDIWKGRRRTFLWSAESYVNPDGSTAYALVCGEVLARGTEFYVAGGSSYLRCNPSGEESEEHTVVYEAIDRYIQQQKVEQLLKP